MQTPRAIHAYFIKGCDPVVCWAEPVLCMPQEMVLESKKIVILLFALEFLAKHERAGVLLKKVSRTFVWVICSYLTLCKEIRHSLWYPCLPELLHLCLDAAFFFARLSVTGIAALSRASWFHYWRWCLLYIFICSPSASESQRVRGSGEWWWEVLLSQF